jgi:S-adenosylmethionine decarboxylase
LNNLISSNATHLGRHLLAEFFDCNENVLNNPSLIEQLMQQAAEACGATIVQTCFHRFSPYGVSGVVVIAESHLTIHTWPEMGYASVDLYTCGDACDPAVAFEFLREKLVSAHACYTHLNRGLLNPQNGELLKSASRLVGEKEIRWSGTASAPMVESVVPQSEVVMASVPSSTGAAVAAESGGR